MVFSPDYLYQTLTVLPAAARCWVAYSGGVDSHALLHALAALRPALPGPIGAVHVNHGLHADAGAWDGHCRAVCAGLDIPYVCLRVDGRAGAGESREAAARAARYAVLGGWLPQGHYLLSAQHQDDQAETLLLQLLRGSGVKGLAAMPGLTEFGGGYLLRPLLDCSRAALLEYAGANRLVWVDDPSNRDVSLDRNFLRHRVLPALRERWPALAGTLSRSARHCAEAAAILEQAAEQDINALAGGAKNTLPISGLCRLPPERQRNVLRYWLAGWRARPPRCFADRHDILHSRGLGQSAGRLRLRRYRDRLYPAPGPGRKAPQWLGGAWIHRLNSRMRRD
jgi:tRNA(Ile)-lysidine synthase